MKNNASVAPPVSLGWLPIDFFFWWKPIEIVVPHKKNICDKNNAEISLGWLPMENISSGMDYQVRHSSSKYMSLKKQDSNQSSPFHDIYSW